MSGILAIWNDFAPEELEHFERWYNREHLQERVGVPGFHFGRRYEAVSGDRRFFCFYEVDSPAVLSSSAYLQRQDNPTPWTRRTMQSFRGMVRTVCDLKASAGDLMGSHAVVVRADETMAPTPAADAWIEALAAEEGIARVQLWTTAAQQTPQTAEMKLRPGGDRRIAGALVVECVRRGDADRVAGMLGKGLPPALGIAGANALGIYALLCVLTKGQV